MRTIQSSDRLAQLIIMFSGAVLIVVGVVLIVVQLVHEMGMPAFTPGGRTLQTSPTGGITLSTTYVGLVVLAIGATLQIVGYVASTPWRKVDLEGPGRAGESFPPSKR